MGAPVPIAGFASKQEAITSLTRRGFDVSEILQTLNPSIPAGHPRLSRQDVQRLQHKARDAGALPPRGCKRHVQALDLSEDLLDDLWDAAQRRNITAKALVRRVLAAVIEDDLIDAVLSDRWADDES